MATTPTPIEHIVICGGGLAGQMTAAALSQCLPDNVRLTLVAGGDLSGTDTFYGNVTAPSAYEFNLSVGLAEPNLVLESNTAFSFGTRYDRWGGRDRSWIQCFQLPLPVLDGVLFHHYLTQQDIGELEPFLIGAVAARNGAFAHPPETAANLLSRAEYGYQFDPESYTRLFAKVAKASRVETIDAKISRIDCGDHGISAIHMSNGDSVTADLYLDCTGPEAMLLTRLGVQFMGGRRLRALTSRKPAQRLGPAYRNLTAHTFGWQADTPLKDSVGRLTIFDPASEPEALMAQESAPLRAVEVTLGRRAQAWCGNCVALGQATAVVEPLTPAPLMLLQRDIERLVSLMPVSHEMSIERREFNRQWMDDDAHVGLFHRALFEASGLPDGPYWRAARATPIDDRLARKLESFESRGLPVAFDLEPFTPEDWTIMHYGMGRRPVRHDRIADKADPARLHQYLFEMRRNIEATVKKLPTHDAYMAGLTRFLAQKGV